MGCKKIFVYEHKTYKRYSITIAPNQKVLQIHRIKSGINFEANYEAMKVLSSNAYVLYMYLLMHKDNRVWALSSQDVCAKTALTEETFPTAVDELIEKKYMVQGEICLGGDTKYKTDAYHLLEKPELKWTQEEENKKALAQLKAYYNSPETDENSSF